MTVCAATNNPGKLKELRRILEKAGHAVKSLRELGITLDPEETGATFAQNARIKAAAFCAASGLPTVADDSGLCVDALGGAPGVFSARYAGVHGDDEANNRKLLAEMQAVPAGQRAARFVSAVCFMLPDGRALTVEGVCPGSVAFAPAGENGLATTRCSSPTASAWGRARWKTPPAAPMPSWPTPKRTPSATAAARWKSSKARCRNS